MYIFLKKSLIFTQKYFFMKNHEKIITAANQLKETKNQSEASWMHPQPAKSFLDPNSKWFERYDQIFQNKGFSLQINLHKG